MRENKHINMVAVIGSGIMGSKIACHFANIGVEVVLLDIIPFDISEEAKKKQRKSKLNRK
jgi:3-hydroxyacyl-CoA dehydrogenase